MSESEFEGHEALIAQLQAGTLEAPDHLRRRVLAGAPAKRRRLAAMSARRRAFLALPAAASLAVVAAAVHGAFVHGNSPPKHGGANLSLAQLRDGSPSPAGAHLPTGVNGATGAAGATGPKGPTGAKGTTGAQGPTAAYGAAGPTARSGTAALTADSAQNAPSHKSAAFGLDALTIPKGRLIHATAYMSVGVRNNRALTRATNDATQIVTRLGGFTQSSQINASHTGYGRAFLDLRVPLAHTEVAIGKLDKLGQVLSQSVSTKDLEQQFTKQTSEIGQLRRAIAIYKQALNSGTLSGSQRVEVQIRLANAEHLITGTRKSRSKLVKSGTTAEIQLNLTTTHHGAVARPHKTGTSRFGRFLHNAGDFLGLEGIIVLYAIMVVVPIALLLALLWWLTRGRRQRDEKRLLASA